jgi:hypothetical protein
MPELYKFLLILFFRPWKATGINQLFGTLATFFHSGFDETPLRQPVTTASNGYRQIHVAFGCRLLGFKILLVPVLTSTFEIFL